MHRNALSLAAAGVACRSIRVPPRAGATGLSASQRSFPLRFVLSRRRRFTLAAVLCAAAKMLASGLHADLFLPVGAADALAGVVSTARTVPAERSAPVVRDVRERRVRIARHELAAARADVGSAGSGRLFLNVRDGVRLDVIVERTAPTRWGYSLSGRVAGGRVGFVTLVVHEEAVAGSIWTPDSAYELRYLDGGVHALRDVTNTPPVECAGAVPAELSALDTTVQANPDDTDDGSVVDVLVIWTPAAEEVVGGEVSMLSLIDRDVAFANDAFERSGAFVFLNLVGAERVDYLETDMYADLDRLSIPDDGHMDRVHDLRDALGADLVHLKTTSDGGVAYLLGAFSINVFAHEVGHNFGIGHERIEGPTAGYKNGFTALARRSCAPSIMSYGVECSSGGYIDSPPFYASPWRYSPGDGRALGVTRFSKKRGARGPADAVLTLNRNRHLVANFRPSRNER